ncbi:MAG: sulfur carrier protein ThiS [Bacteroidota bacterium]|nr:sulfur carrier protein ThiS [Bacteroidota bacterium]
MHIFINKEKTEIGKGQSLGDLLLELNIAAFKGIAIAINNNIIPKASWEIQHLQDQDHVTIIKATQGG